MPTAVYSEWAGTKTPYEAPGAVAWTLLAALVVMSALGGWASRPPSSDGGDLSTVSRGCR